MKLPSGAVLAGIIFTVFLLVTTAEGGRGRRKQKRPKACRYKKQVEMGDCNPDTGNMDVRYQLKGPGRLGCQPTKIRTRRCPGCKYPKRSVPFGECVNGLMTKTIPLGPGSMAECPETRIVTRKCRGMGAGTRKRGRKKGGKRGGGCVYVNKEWTQCDLGSKTRQRERVLVSGDSKACLPKKMVTKKCRKACRYLKGDWSECDSVTNMKNRTMDPKPGSLPNCKSKIQEKPCFVGAGSIRGKPTKCRYRFGVWTPCDPRTNTRTQEMNLRKGDPNLCKRTLSMTRKCKPACKFQQGEWSECDKMTRLMTRLDTLVKGDPQDCDKQRQITRKCKKSKCKYTLGEWSECQPDTNSRSRLKTLVSGNPDLCQENMTISKSCIGKHGEVRCFFGFWGEFGSCTNGVMTKQRPLLQGGVECERRAVVTKACGDD